MKEFRDEMTAQRKIYYIPVTMDELMARFVTNIERNECKTRFRQDKKILSKSSLREVDPALIVSGVTNSFSSLKDLLGNNTIYMERQPNSENHLYLKLMERAQEENKLSLINMLSSKLCHLIKARKPSHLI